MPRLSTRRSLSVAMLTIFLETGLSSIAGAQQILQVLELRNWLFKVQAMGDREQTAL